MRESDEEFARERASRYLLGVAFMIARRRLHPGELLRCGSVGRRRRRDRVQRRQEPATTATAIPTASGGIDTIRQISSVVLTCAYLFGVHDPTLIVASLLYCVPYVVILVLAGFAAWGHRPAMPGPPRQMAMLIGEMGIGTAALPQGDVLLLGWLTNSTVVGYYTITLDGGHRAGGHRAGVRHDLPRAAAQERRRSVGGPEAAHHARASRRSSGDGAHHRHRSCCSRPRRHRWPRP